MRFKNNLLRFTISFAALIPVYAQAEDRHICWVAKVELATEPEVGLKVYLRPESRHVLRGINGKEGRRSPPTDPEWTFILLGEGESAGLSGLPEDACTATAIRQDGSLRLELEANTCFHGNCSHAHEVVSPKP